jgi:hypothetical protein
VPDLISAGDRQEDEVGHQAHGVARRPVLAGLLVVLLVELADQLLEDRAHRVVVDAGRERSMSGSRNLLISVPRRRPWRASELVAELEVVEDVLDVGREAVEVVLEVGEELLLAAAGLEVAQGELRGVVEGLAAAAQRAARCSVMPASSSIFLVSSTFFLVGSSTASMRRMTHMGRITSGYLPRLKRSRRTSSAMPQMKETILLWVAWSITTMLIPQPWFFCSGSSPRSRERIYRCNQSPSPSGSAGSSFTRHLRICFYRTNILRS